MRYRKLGRTGLKVSALCLGTMQWGWTANESAAFEVMDAFAEKGGNFLDTADFYSRWIPGNEGGESESIIGRWLQARHKRSEIILSTKIYQPMSDDPNSRGLSRKHILEGVDASLRRLQTDYIDLYLAHAFDADTPIDETLKAFDDLQRMGKVRYVGASNYPAWRLMESLWSADVHDTVRYDVLEPHYNLVHRAEFESELKLICEQYQIGVIPYSSLAGGFLTGKYKPGEESQGARANSIARNYNFEAAWRTVDVVQRIAQELETTPTAVSLAWLLAQPVISAPITGANNTDQLFHSLEAVDLTLSPEQIAALNQVSSWD
ncbi:aldo/keto reductase [Dictyobacter kobayashii]|uniref:NADP-dependent aryl-alcohol dehydrogenase n=1 Tax=Dictyobacter kobayashii TaxID=2014872 RepID=A0A402AFF2_9CHLR|nr:aldo/keto reductase [Dictyobacter kobayashii]GCE17829.1 NADP-dependent aryl-alcohol dehydrogenase [Dictyobacter kobayashii]